MREHVSRKVTLAAFFLFIFFFALISPSFSREYGESHRITLKLNALGYVPGLASDASNETVYDYTESVAKYSDAIDMALAVTGAKINDEGTDYSTSVPYLRSDMTSGFTENGVFIFPDNIGTSMPDSEDFGTAHIYELALRLLGYNSADFGTTHESVIEYARDLKFGFSLPVRYSLYVKKGEMAQIFYEALFLPVKPNGYSLARVIAETDPERKTLLVDSGMLDDMPTFAPFYTKSPYLDESYTYLVTLATAQNDERSEWNATYIMADASCYSSYKTSMASDHWILETEYTRKNNDIEELCSLYYKTINNKEHYLLLRFNEEQSKVDIWIGV